MVYSQRSGSGQSAAVDQRARPPVQALEHRTRRCECCGQPRLRRWHTPDTPRLPL